MVTTNKYHICQDRGCTRMLLELKIDPKQIISSCLWSTRGSAHIKLEWSWSGLTSAEYKCRYQVEIGSNSERKDAENRAGCSDCGNQRYNISNNGDSMEVSRK